MGRDVDAIARDLVEVAIRMVEREKLDDLKPRAAKNARERLLDLLAPIPQSQSPNPFAAGFPNLVRPERADRNRA